MVKVRVAEYVPVLKVGLFDRVKLFWTVLGLAELHDPPPPVHTPAPMVSTLVCDATDVVCVPEHAVPRVAELHV